MDNSISVKQGCVTIKADQNKTKHWKELFEKRYGDFLNRIDGFFVTVRDDEQTKRTACSIHNSKYKSQKKAVLTISVYKTTGTVMVQGQFHQIWTDNELKHIHDILASQKEHDYGIHDFGIALENSIMSSSIIPEKNIPIEKIPMLDYDSMDDDVEPEEPVQNPNTDMETFKKSILTAINLQDKKIDDLEIQLKKSMEYNRDLNEVNKQLTKEIKTLKQNGKERDDLYAGEREQFLKKISLLETKYAELKSQCNDVKQVNSSLKSELHGFIQKHEDGVYCDKKYDKVALADIKAETIMAREDIETNKKNLSEFKTKVLDKLNHLSQVTNSVSKQISQPRHSNGSKEDINTMNEKQQHSTPVKKLNGEYPDAISDNDTLNTHVAPSQNTRDLSKIEITSKNACLKKKSS